MADLKQRRKDLGLSRADLARQARVDKRVLQLIELDLSEDEESISRVTRALDALEAGEPLPDFDAEVEAIIEEQRANTLRRPPPTPDDGT